MAAIWGYVEPLRILCTRELQVSIKESMFAEIRNAILSEPWLSKAYDIGENYIRGENGTEFIFRGLRHNMEAIKSMAQIDLCIIEEAEDAPESSWQNLEPTIRADKSEIWCIWNPRTDGSPVDKRFRKNTPPRAMVVEMKHEDNPWFPKVLDEQRRYQQTVLDPNTYAHIWDGAYLTNSKAQVFADKYRVADFVPAENWNGPYFGLDFGFAQDPTAAVKCWVADNQLYIERCAGRVGLELDHTANYVLDAMPEAKSHTIRADSTRPVSISYLRRHGLPKITAVEKGKGSVEDGVAHIRAYKSVVIHPDCKPVIDEFRLYSYKIDRLSGDPLPEIIDANNHYIDAIRYAIQPLIKTVKSFYIGKT